MSRTALNLAFGTLRSLVDARALSAETLRFQSGSVHLEYRGNESQLFCPVLVSIEAAARATINAGIQIRIGHTKKAKNE